MDSPPGLPVICTECGSDLAGCACDDIDERMAALRDSLPKIGPFALPFCADCDRHQERCVCGDGDE